MSRVLSAEEFDVGLAKVKLQQLEARIAEQHKIIEALLENRTLNAKLTKLEMEALRDRCVDISKENAKLKGNYHGDGDLIDKLNKTVDWYRVRYRSLIANQSPVPISENHIEQKSAS